MQKSSRKKPVPQRTAKRRGSKSKYTLYYIIAMVAFLAVMAILSLTVFFNIESIVVEGNTRYLDDELIDSTGVVKGDNLLRISTSQISDVLSSKYPYIKDVNLARTFPTTLKIILTEREAVATVEFENKSYLLDTQGRVLEIEAVGTHSEFQRIVGVDMQGLAVGDFITVKSELVKFNTTVTLISHLEENILWMDVIDATTLSTIWMLYEGRVAIYLGGTTELDYKIRFAAQALNDSMEENFVGVLDVSVRPYANMRPSDIFKEENWPFPFYLLDDYERVLLKE